MSLIDSNSMRISVALCTCNGERYIAEQLQSILRQVAPVYEIVVCDDLSTDETFQIARKYLQESDVRYTLVQNTKRLGVTKNFEKCIGLCTGDIIATCDQDDVWDIYKTGKLAEAFCDEECTLAFSDAYIIDGNGMTSQQTLHQRVRFLQNGATPDHYLDAIARMQYTVHGCLMAFRRSLVEQICPFPVTELNHDAWIMYCARLAGQAKYIKAPLMSYRIHDANVTQSEESQNKWRCMAYTGDEYDIRFSLHTLRKQRCELMSRACQINFGRDDVPTRKSYKKAIQIYRRLVYMKQKPAWLRLLVLMGSFLDGSYSYRILDRSNQDNGIQRRIKLFCADLIFLMRYRKK